ncbi:MAG: type III pantothenate kinase [Bacillota bacterium]|nr:type III pantothenate kinase [Bacillota bacterium]
MLLVVNINNTNTSLGVYDGERLVKDWRVATVASRTVDEIGLLFCNLMALGGVDREQIDGVAAASVVPPVVPTWEEAIRRYLAVEPLWVGPGVKTGVPIRYENPKEVGADRIVNAVATIARWGTPAIAIDFGTATTFDAISAQGEYLGGAICPGLGIAADALFSRTAKLPRVEFLRPEKVIGKTTVASIQAGLMYGTVGQVREITRRMAGEIGGRPKVIATGGLAPVIAGDVPEIDAVDPHLTLEGLRLVWERNARDAE